MNFKTIAFLSAACLFTGCGASDDSGLTPIDMLQSAEVNTGQTALPKERLSQLSTRQDYFSMKRCINMGNALEAEKEGSWGYTIKEGHFRAIAAAGFDTVRIPIRWDAHTETRPPYKIDPTFFKRVNDVVGQAQEAGLGVIIDVHHYEKLMKNVRAETPRFLAIWKQIATYYRTAPPNVYFEPINEPIAPMTMAQANALYAQVLPIIRQDNPTRAVILGGDNWNSIDSLNKVVFPKDPYLVATFHDYGPYDFTHQGATWQENAPPLGRKWGRADDLKELAATYDIAREFQKRTGLPVLVGEFGVTDVTNSAERARWLTIRRRSIEQTGMRWCAWDFAGAFKSYDVDKNQWLPGIKEALTGP